MPMQKIIYDGRDDPEPNNCTVTILNNGSSRVEIFNHNGYQYDDTVSSGKIVDYKNMLTFRTKYGNNVIFKDTEQILGIYSSPDDMDHDTAKFICYNNIMYVWYLHTDFVETSQFLRPFSRGKDLPVEYFKKNTLTLLVALLREFGIDYDPTLVEYGTVIIDYDPKTMMYNISDGHHDISIVTVDENQ